MYKVMEEDSYEFQDVDLPDGLCFCPQVDYNNQTDSLFFNDGVRSVDFILVYEDEETKPLDKNYTFKRRKVSFSFLTHARLPEVIMQSILN